MTAVRRDDFWKRHPGLVWSSSVADDSVHIQAALLRLRFSRLLEIAGEFGLERIRHEWGLLRQENTPEGERAAAAVERILRHIEEGFARASSRH